MTNFRDEIACKYKDLYCSDVVQPKISVVIPAYNVEKYIEKCLSSLLSQTFKEFEVVIVDDGSSDLTSEIIRAFCHFDKRFKLISQNNQGVSIARNVGIKEAKAPYLCFIDSDDWVDENFLEKHFKAIEENNADITVGSIIRWREYNQKYRIHITDEKTFETLEEKVQICNVPKCCYTVSKLYKTDLIKNHHFCENVYFEDVLWIPEVLKQSGKIVTVSDTNYYYRVVKSSIVKSERTNKKQADNYNAQKYIVEFFEENNLKLAEKRVHITKQIKYFCKIPVLKIKEYKATLTYYLFGFLPIFKKHTGDAS